MKPGGLQSIGAWRRSIKYWRFAQYRMIKKALEGKPSVPLVCFIYETLIMIDTIEDAMILI